MTSTPIEYAIINDNIFLNKSSVVEWLRKVRNDIEKHKGSEEAYVAVDEIIKKLCLIGKVIQEQRKSNE